MSRGTTVPNRPINVGIVGCGDILAAYMTGFARFGALVRVTRLADVELGRAITAAERYRIAHAGGVDALWSDDEVELVVSLTPPLIHDRIIKDASAVGKSVYTEKPLSATTSLARQALEVAEQGGIVVGSAPDTFLGSTAQTARAVVDRGDIGEVVAAAAFAPYNRAERRHPNPGFLFQAGAGPSLDIAPYHISWLIHLLGPVVAVAGLAGATQSVRKIRTFNGQLVEVPIEIDTHVASVIEFSSGVIGTFVCSFDIWANRLPAIEIYGSHGTLSLPHPNWYDGAVEVRLHDDEEWRTVEPILPSIQAHPTEKVRGLGVIDLAESLGGAVHRTNSGLALHTLEVLEGMELSSRRGEFVAMASHPTRPAPLDRTDLERWTTRSNTGITA